MLRFFRSIAVITVFLFFVSGCSRLSEEESTSTAPKTKGVVVVDLVKNDLRNGESVSPYISVIIQNNLDKVALNLTAEVSLLRLGSPLGPAVEVDLSTTLSPVQLDPLQKASFELVFSSIDSHDDYDQIKFDFKWNEENAGQVLFRSVSF